MKAFPFMMNNVLDGTVICPYSLSVIIMIGGFDTFWKPEAIHKLSSYDQA
jgi:hypothetical protein